MTTHHSNAPADLARRLVPADQSVSAHSRTGSTPATATRASTPTTKPRRATVTTIGHLVGVTRQTLYRWRNNGIPWSSAAPAAIHARAHPVELGSTSTPRRRVAA